MVLLILLLLPSAEHLDTDQVIHAGQKLNKNIVYVLWVLQSNLKKKKPNNPQNTMKEQQQGNKQCQKDKLTSMIASNIAEELYKLAKQCYICIHFKDLCQCHLQCHFIWH